MTNDFNGVSNWTLATRTKPGERYVYREPPPNPITGPTPDAWSRVGPRRRRRRPTAPAMAVTEPTVH